MSVSTYPVPLSGIQETITDAKGDIIAATAADTVARLAVGANGTVLTAASGQATGLEWATPSSGGMTLLSTTTLSGASTTISSISGAYTNLQVIVYGVTNATSDGNFQIAPNGSTNITSFINTNGSQALVNKTVNYLFLTDPSSAGRNLYTSNENAWVLNLPLYSNTSMRKQFSVTGGYLTSSTSPSALGYLNSGLINTTSAITSLEFSNTSGNFNSGTVLIYGVK
jgi:hypothetical protein